VSERATATERRARRRRETTEEVLEVALAVMAESGAAGLSLGEVARRMGIRPPSLYEYFDSKNAIYDELFARGWRQLSQWMARYDAPLQRSSGIDEARKAATAAVLGFVQWAVEHPTYAQLMFWRPVPGFTPSAAAYRHAVEALDWVDRALRSLADRGFLRIDAGSDEAVGVLITMVTGVISQHLANEPAATFAKSRHCAMVPVLTEMFFNHFSTSEDPDDSHAGGAAATDTTRGSGQGHGGPDRRLRRAAARPG